MKSGRHAKILEIINRQSVETQEELLKCLRQEGFNVTQATVSRDIKQLRLVKALGSDGRYRYVSAAENTSDDRSSFGQFYSSTVVSVDTAQNLVVIRTRSGMANAFCAALDSTENSAIVGTIAGDDTIFIACRTSEQAEQFVKELRIAGTK